MVFPFQDRKLYTPHSETLYPTMKGITMFNDIANPFGADCLRARLPLRLPSPPCTTRVADWRRAAPASGPRSEAPVAHRQELPAELQRLRSLKARIPTRILVFSFRRKYTPHSETTTKGTIMTKNTPPRTCCSAPSSRPTGTRRASARAAPVQS
jgi:hypothetical protein